jgi:hypothetical protein
MAVVAIGAAPMLDSVNNHCAVLRQEYLNNESPHPGLQIAYNNLWTLHADCIVSCYPGIDSVRRRVPYGVYAADGIGHGHNSCSGPL